MKSKFKNRIMNFLKSKKGNTFLFMPYICIFGCSFIYIFMDMGTAYARSIEIQSIADAGCRAGVYGGMNGEYTQYIIERYDDENYHVYIMLDGGTAMAVAREVILENLTMLSIETGDTVLETTPGKLYIGTNNIKLSDPSVFEELSDVHGVNTIPIWKAPVEGSGTGNYVAVPISNFQNYQEVMKSGNFFVYIQGEYKTIMAGSILGKESIHLEGFAAAVATAYLSNE